MQCEISGFVPTAQAQIVHAQQVKHICTAYTDQTSKVTNAATIAREAHLEGPLQVIWLGSGVLLANGVGHKALHGSCEPVWTQSAEDEQALKFRHALPVTRQRLIFWPL